MRRPLFSSSLPVLLILATACGGSESDTDGPAEEILEPVERRLLHEMFSGSNCGPCLEADARVLEIVGANPERHVLLAYQVGSDPYMTTETVNRRMYYLPGEDTYAIPYLHVDGVNELHPNEAHDGEGYLADDFDAFAAELSPLEIRVTHTLTDQTVDYEVTVEPMVDVPSDKLILHVAIIEGVTYNNVGINGQTEFHHVMKKMVPDDSGTKLDPLLAGEPVVISGSYTFMGDYVAGTGPSNLVDHATEHTVEEFEDLSVVVFVQDKKTWQVHQSAWSGLTL